MTDDKSSLNYLSNYNKPLKTFTPENTETQPLSSGYELSELHKLKKQNEDLQDQLKQKEEELALKDSLIKRKDAKIS